MIFKTLRHGTLSAGLWPEIRKMGQARLSQIPVPKLQHTYHLMFRLSSEHSNLTEKTWQIRASRRNQFATAFKFWCLATLCGKVSLTQAHRYWHGVLMFACILAVIDRPRGYYDSKRNDTSNSSTCSSRDRQHVCIVFVVRCSTCQRLTSG